MATKHLALFATRSAVSVTKPRGFRSGLIDSRRFSTVDFEKELNRLNEAIGKRNGEREANLSSWRKEYEDNLNKKFKEFVEIQKSQEREIYTAAMNYSENLRIAHNQLKEALISKKLAIRQLNGEVFGITLMTLASVGVIASASIRLFF